MSQDPSGEGDPSTESAPAKTPGESAAEDPRGPKPQRDFTVDDVEEGSRLETFLQKSLGYPRSTALKAIRKGWVRLDGKRAKGGQRLAIGDVVRITNYGLLPHPAATTVEPPPNPRGVSPTLRTEAEASIRHEDEHLVVSSKPSGVVVHRGSGHDAGWIDAVGVVVGARLTPVGRLDRDTSGLLALSRGRLGARRLFESLKDGSLRRTYLAVVQGEPKRKQGRITHPLAKWGDEGEERMQVDPEGLPATTVYRVLTGSRRASLLQVELETGRTHQIRVHLAAEGHPVLGDPRYGTGASHGLSMDLELERLFLHAETLVLPHPETGEKLTFRDELPEELVRVLKRLGLS